MKFDGKIQKNIIILAVIFLVLIVLAIYFTVRNKQQKPKIKTEAQISEVTSEPMLFPTISADNKFYFYSNTRDLAFYKQNIDGSGLEKISINMDQPNGVTWSPDQKYAILNVIYNKNNFEKFGSVFASPTTEDQAITNWAYNFQSQKLTKLNDNIGNIIWQKNNRIIYQQKNEDKSTLNMSDWDGGNAQKIIDLPSAQDFGFSFLSNDQLVVFNQPTDVSEGVIYTLSLSERKLKEIKKTATPSMAVGLSSNKIIFRTQNDNFKASLLNIDGSTDKNLDIRNDLQYYADLGSDQIILTEQSYLFFLINTKTGIKSLIKNAKTDNITAQNLFPSPDRKVLYFTSNNILYQLTVPDIN